MAIASKPIIFAVRKAKQLGRLSYTTAVCTVQVTGVEMGAAAPVLRYPNRRQGKRDSPGMVQGLEKDTNRKSNRCPTIVPRLQLTYLSCKFKYFGLKMHPQSSISTVIQVPRGLLLSGSVCWVGSISCGMSEKLSAATERPARHFFTLHFCKKKNIFKCCNTSVFKCCSGTPDSILPFYSGRKKRHFTSKVGNRLFLVPCPVEYLKLKRGDKYSF